MVVAALITTTAPAVAATTGAERFTLFGQDETATVIATGTWLAVGESVTIDDNNDLFVFPNGAFKVNHPQTGGSDTFNERACVGASTFNGTFTLSQGTGAYAGISGSGAYSGKAVFWSPRTATGCSGTGGGSTFFVNATGTTTLP